MAASTYGHPGSFAFGATLGLAIVLLLSGGAKVYLGIVRPALDVMEARGWIPVPLESARAHVSNFHGIVYADFEYEYRVGARAYHGTRYAFVHPTAFLSDDKLFAMERSLPRTCYVDPLDSSHSVIARTLPTRAYRYAGLPIFGTGCLLVAWVIACGTRSARSAGIARMATRLAGAALAVWGCTWLSQPRIGVAVSSAILVGSGLALNSAKPAALRTVAAVISLLGTIGCCMGMNPLLWAEINTDATHDPQFQFEYFLNWFSMILVAWAIARLAYATAVYLEPEGALPSRSA